MPKTRAIVRTMLFIVAAGFLWLFLSRYWFWRDCIDLAQSSCMTPEGANLTAGGMLWAVPAAVAFVVAVAI